MINEKLINPDSIVVVGGSDDLFKPGGKVLKNIIDGKYRRESYMWLIPNKIKSRGLNHTGI